MGGQHVEVLLGPLRRRVLVSVVLLAIFPKLTVSFYFFPSFIWTSLTIFDWISWIKPTNGKLVALTSGNWGVGLGFNPLATFDYSYLISPGGYFPQFIHNNFIAGVTVAMIASAIVWFRNGFDTGYLPINNSSTFDNRGESFSVLKIVDKNGVLDESKYQRELIPGR